MAHPDAPDLTEAQRFVMLLDENADKYTFQTFDDSEAKRPHLARVLHGTLAEHAATVSQLNREGAGVFVTINETDLLGREIGNVRRVRAVFADLDGAPLEPVLACALEPNLIVVSSPDRWHAYWFVDSLPLDQFKLVQKAIAARFNSDSGVCDLPRVLRLPGFLHRKAEPFLVRIIMASGAQSYSADAIRAEFLPPQNPMEAKSPKVGAPSRGTAKVIARERHTDVLFLTAKFARMVHQDGLARESALAALATEAARHRWTRDVPQDEIVRAFDGALEKYASGEFRIPRGSNGENPSDGSDTLRVIDIGDLSSANQEETRYAVRPIVPAGLLTLLGAHGGTGKSMLALIIAAHFAASRQWGPFEMRGGKAVFVSLEDPGEMVRWRLRQIADEYALDYQMLSENLRIIDGSNGDGVLVCEDVTQGARRLVETSNLAKLRQLVGGALFVVVDNASDAFDGNENDRRMVRAFVRKLAQIARENDAGMLLLAHVDKAAARYGSHGNAYSGSTAWNNSARSRLAMEEKDGGVELRHEKFNLGKRAESVKLIWSHAGVLTLDSNANAGAQIIANLGAANDAEYVLSALRAAAVMGTNVPTARRGSVTAQAVLETFSALPEMLHGTQGRKRFWRAIDWLVAEDCVSLETYRDSSRHERQRFAIVGAEDARARLSPIPPANERAQIARPALVCESSQTAAELPQTAASDEPSDE